GPVADLVVVLEAHHEPVGRYGGIDGATVVPLPEGREGAVVHEDVGQRLGQRRRSTEVDVVAVPLAGDQRVQRVVEVVVPRCVQTGSTGCRFDHEAWVVPVGFGGDQERPAE